VREEDADHAAFPAAEIHLAPEDGRIGAKSSGLGFIGQDCNTGIVSPHIPVGDKVVTKQRVNAEDPQIVG
jgi:hypothetical protein